MSLMMLGPVIFDLRFNPQSTSEEAEVPFAKHEVVGSPPIYEDMGEGERSFSIEGVCYPEHFGGLDQFSALEAARAQRLPVVLMRGDYIPVGWVLIQKLSRSDDVLDAVGVGREVTFSATLLKVGTPSADMASSLMGLFG